MSDLLSKITAPTLILKADAEPDIRKQEIEIASLLANGKIVHIAGAGHNIRREQKESLIKTLSLFLGELQ